MSVLEVVECVSDWKILGLNLGLLYHPTLTDIETYRHHKPEDCKKDMLLAWLQQKDNVTQTGIPSWSVLRDALTRIGEHETASRVVSGNINLHIIVMFTSSFFPERRVINVWSYNITKF